MKVGALGQVYGKRFACPPLRTNHVLPALGFKSNLGAQLAREFAQATRFGEQAGRHALEVSGIAQQLQQIVGKPVNFKFENMFKNEAAGLAQLAQLTKRFEPALYNYEQAQRRASRRYGVIAGLEAPGEASIVALTAAFTALAAGDQARLQRLHRRLRAQARNGDQQAEALATWLDFLLELIAAEELGRLLLLVRALKRIAERRILRALGRSLTRARSSPPWQDPITSGHCPHAPPAISAVPYCPEVAA